MKIFKKALMVLGIALVILFVIGFFLPSQVVIQRSVVIHATPAQIHPLVEDLKRWMEWSVWTKEMDPTVTYTYAGLPQGADAEMTWAGEKMGSGTLKISKSEPGVGVWYLVEFNHGSMSSIGSIVYQAVSEGTEVTWKDTMELGKNPINRYFGLLMDSMIGADFDTGLARLKHAVENMPAAH